MFTWTAKSDYSGLTCIYKGGFIREVRRVNEKRLPCRDCSHKNKNTKRINRATKQPSILQRRGGGADQSVLCVNLRRRRHSRSGLNARAPVIAFMCADILINGKLYGPFGELLISSFCGCLTRSTNPSVNHPSERIFQRGDFFFALPVTSVLVHGREITKRKFFKCVYANVRRKNDTTDFDIYAQVKVNKINYKICPHLSFLIMLKAQF